MVESVKVQDLLPSMATTPGDSTGEMLSIHHRDDDPSADRFHYELCSFTNVCANSDGLHLFVQDEREYNQLHATFDHCFRSDHARAPQGMFGPCHCFYPQFKVSLLPFYRKTVSDAKENAPTDKTDANAPSRTRQTSVHPLLELNHGHYASIHKYVRIHHIGKETTTKCLCMPCTSASTAPSCLLTSLSCWLPLDDLSSQLTGRRRSSSSRVRCNTHTPYPLRTIHDTSSWRAITPRTCP